MFFCHMAQIEFLDQPVVFDYVLVSSDSECYAGSLCVNLLLQTRRDRSVIMKLTAVTIILLHHANRWNVTFRITCSLRLDNTTAICMAQAWQQWSIWLNRQVLAHGDSLRIRRVSRLMLSCGIKI